MTKSTITILLISIITLSSCGDKNIAQKDIQKGNVIFLHPDGTGLATWNVLRILEKGPDGQLNWDNLSDIGLYKSHTKSSLTTSSNAGATMHAYGQKVHYHSFGMDREKELTALSGKKMSIMQEAMSAGISAGGASSVSSWQRASAT